MYLALFDFDGTITTKDSLADFIKYAVGYQVYYLGLIALSPLLILYILKIIPNHLAKERMISHYFQGWELKRFREIANEYSMKQIDNIIRSKALTAIKWHQSKGHKVIVVSASMEDWLIGWCKKNNLELFATKLEVKNGKLTGKFITKNCYGIEKVNRIKSSYNLNDFDGIYAYGDSKGDKYLLDIASYSFYKPFRD